MKYIIVTEASTKMLAQIVNEHIEIGLKPLGGPNVDSDEDYQMFFQAMIDETEDQ